MELNSYHKSFFALLRAGLWGAYGNHNDNLCESVDWTAVRQMAEEQSVVGLIADSIDRF